jgi:hypothetical protein
MNISLLYLDIPGAGGAAAAPDKGEVITGHARLQVHSQTIHGCTLIFQVRVVVLLLQMKERSLQDTLASRYTYKTIHGCTLIFQVRVVVLLLQMKERSLQDTLASRYT